MKEARFVYMLRTEYDKFPTEGWLVKIGVAKNIKKRMSNIQSGCPFKLYLQASAKTYNPSKYENIIHKSLSEFKTNGEWFLVNDDTFDDLVNALCEIQKEFRSEHALV